MTLQVCISYKLQLKLYDTIHYQTVKLYHENFQQLNGNKKGESNPNKAPHSLSAHESMNRHCLLYKISIYCHPQQTITQ